MNVIFSELASRELTKTARDYEDKAPGLGRLFLSEVEAAAEERNRIVSARRATKKERHAYEET